MRPDPVKRGNAISVWVWLALAFLVLLALAVIFVLPRLVQQYELPLVPRTAPAPVVNSGGLNTPASPQVSPFDEAQRARQRREAQDVLASLLRRQAALDEVAVLQWAAEDYESAIAAARRGDESYRSGEFDQATLAYQQGDRTLAQIQQRQPDVLAGLLDEGNSALAAQDSALAMQSFSVAVAMDPENAEARQGLQRAQSLDEVEALLSEGLRLQTQGDLQAAAEMFQQATSLDSAHVRAEELLADNRQRMTDAEYTGIMSEGFALLQEGRADAAVSAFERALRVKPGSTQASEAIAQTREQITLEAIAGIRQQAEAFETAEDWEQAVAAYDSALELDSNLVFAVEGKDYSERRLQLDRLLQLNIEQPERLADPAAYDEALEVFRVGSDLAADLIAEQGAAGDRLNQQLTTTENLLQQMRIPVEVTLVSDNATQVTIYQVGQLGSFAETTVMLTPGRYVAVGKRPGYRDVRKEFVVGFGQQLNSLTIRCNEEVAAVNRP